MDTERILANGEVWQLRGPEWHMVGYEPESVPFDGDYAPVSTQDFDSYAASIEAGERRSPKLN